MSCKLAFSHHLAELFRSFFLLLRFILQDFSDNTCLVRIGLKVYLVTACSPELERNRLLVWRFRAEWWLQHIAVFELDSISCRAEKAVTIWPNHSICEVYVDVAHFLWINNERFKVALISGGENFFHGFRLFFRCLGPNFLPDLIIVK